MKHSSRTDIKHHWTMQMAGEGISGGDELMFADLLDDDNGENLIKLIIL